jgi:uncharacterized protein YcfJ
MTAGRSTALGLAAALLLAGSASAEMFPSVLVTPGPNKPIEVFHQDQRECRGYADGIVAGGPSPTGDVIGGAVVGTALGALLGAAINERHGAGTGAAIGAVAGVAAGAGAAERDQAHRQEVYDDAYARCMYAHDDILPGQGPGDAPPPPPPPGAPPR